MPLKEQICNGYLVSCDFDRFYSLLEIHAPVLYVSDDSHSFTPFHYDNGWRDKWRMKNEFRRKHYRFIDPGDIVDRVLYDVVLRSSVEKKSNEEDEKPIFIIRPEFGPGSNKGWYRDPKKIRKRKVSISRVSFPDVSLIRAVDVRNAMGMVRDSLYRLATDGLLEIGYVRKLEKESYDAEGKRQPAFANTVHGGEGREKEYGGDYFSSCCEGLADKAGGERLVYEESLCGGRRKRKRVAGEYGYVPFGGFETDDTVNGAGEGSG